MGWYEDHGRTHVDIVGATGGLDSLVAFQRLSGNGLQTLGGYEGECQALR